MSALLFAFSQKYSLLMAFGSKEAFKSGDKRIPIKIQIIQQMKNLKDIKYIYMDDFLIHEIHVFELQIEKNVWSSQFLALLNSCKKGLNWQS